jgi:hypothetical protein
LFFQPIGWNAFVVVVGVESHVDHSTNRIPTVRSDLSSRFVS